MNRKEVMALSDEELLAWVAKLTGHTNSDNVPDYLNSDAAAWGLWCRLIKAGYRVELYSRAQEWPERYYCMVGLPVEDVPDADSERWTTSLEEAIKEAWENEIKPDNKARAIARAFVLAMSRNDEDD